MMLKNRSLRSVGVRSFTLVFIVTCSSLVYPLGSHGANFAGEQIQFPVPEKLCLLGDDPLEIRQLRRNQFQQRVGGIINLAIWIDCPSQKAIQAGGDWVVDDWAMIGAALSQDYLEQKYSKEALDFWLKQEKKTIGIRYAKKNTEKIEKNSKIVDRLLYGKEISKSKIDVRDVGIVKEGHNYFICIMEMNRKYESKASQPVIGVSLTTHKNGIPLYYYRYSHVVSKQNLEQLIEEVDAYRRNLLITE